MRKRVQQLDEQLMRRAAGWRSPSRDRSLVAITQAADYSGLWVAIGATLVTVGGHRGRAAAERGLLGVMIAAVLANGPAKALVRRGRPVAGASPTLIPMPRSTSFPSGHSASASAFATGVCTELPGLAPLLVPLAGAVAYSRTHTGVHYPSDVAAGVGLGIGSGLIAGRLLAGRERRRARRARAGTSA
jgi:undecaprenyl-diphosphatase